MRVEVHPQSAVLDIDSDLSHYRLIILPDNVLPVPSLVEKLRIFVAKGGALLATYRSLLDEAETSFALTEFGVYPLGPSKFKGEYLVPRGDNFPGVANDAYYLYQQGLSIEPVPGANVLAVYGHPYFDRSPEHWCSHAQTPVSHITDEPIITRMGDVIYCANPFFASYALDGELVQKLLVSGMIMTLLPRPAIRCTGVPSTARVTLMENESNGNQLVQILYAPYERRAPLIDIIEEPATFVQGSIEVRRSHAPRSVSALDADGRVADVAFIYRAGYVGISLPRITGQLALSIT
jgi:hypothetical protein